MSRAVSSSSKDSCSITWHQWQAGEPTESKIGRCSRRARSSASSPHGYHSTGFPACWRRYGLVSPARRFTSPVFQLVLVRSLLEPPRGVDRGRQGEALRTRLRDQEDGLDGVDVVDPLLAAA